MRGKGSIRAAAAVPMILALSSCGGGPTAIAPTQTPVPEERCSIGGHCPVIFVGIEDYKTLDFPYSLYPADWEYHFMRDEDRDGKEGQVSIVFGVADYDLSSVEIYVDGKLEETLGIGGSSGYGTGAFTLTGMEAGKSHSVRIVGTDSAGNISFEQVSVEDGKGVTARKESADAGPPMIFVQYAPLADVVNKRTPEVKDFPLENEVGGDFGFYLLERAEGDQELALPAELDHGLARAYVFDERLKNVSFSVGGAVADRIPQRIGIGRYDYDNSQEGREAAAWVKLVIPENVYFAGGFSTLMNQKLTVAAQDQCPAGSLREQMGLDRYSATFVLKREG